MKNDDFKVIKNEGLLEWDKEFEDMRDKFVSDEAFEAYKSIFEYVRTHPEEIAKIDRELDKKLGIDDDDDESHYEVVEEKQKEYERILTLVKSLKQDNTINNIVYDYDCRYGYKSISFNLVKSHLTGNSLSVIISILQLSDEGYIRHYDEKIIMEICIDKIYRKKQGI